MKTQTTDNKKVYKEAVLDLGIINEFRVYYNHIVYNFNFENRLFKDEDRVSYITNQEVVTALEGLNPVDLDEIKKVLEPIRKHYLDEVYDKVLPLMDSKLGFSVLLEEMLED